MMAALNLFVAAQDWRSDMRTQFTLIAFGSLLVSFLLLVPADSFAQKKSPTGAGGGTPGRDAILTREADIQGREMRLRLLTESEKTTTLTNEHAAEVRKLIVSQIFEDFEKIQLVNREMTQLSSNLTATAYKRMSTLAEEMGKRAKRLKTNLGIPDLNNEKKDSESVAKTPAAPEMDSAQVQASLQTISASVKSFVSNPLFQDPRVTDVRHLDNLRRDIATLIELSRAVKKAAAKLSH